MPILNNSLLRDVFLRDISLRVSGREGYGESNEGYAHPLVYFGSGYWRGLWSTDRKSIRLINPSLRWDEERKVEEGICILLGFKFIENQEERWPGPEEL